MSVSKVKARRAMKREQRIELHTDAARNAATVALRCLEEGDYGEAGRYFDKACSRAHLANAETRGK